MYLIVGLGNPENEYSHTRHNMGFDTINILAEKNEIKIVKNKFQGIYGDGYIAGEKVILLKPQTYMNLSGKSLVQYANFYKIESDHIFVIYDDMDVEVGKIKIRKKGGPGSHNGMKSIISELNTEDFPRIRVGIGRPNEYQDRVHYVIGKVSSDEAEELKKGTKEAAKAIEEILRNGLDKAMNLFN